jgi:hypothetical protein
VKASQPLAIDDVERGDLSATDLERDGHPEPTAPEPGPLHRIVGLAQGTEHRVGDAAQLAPAGLVLAMPNINVWNRLNVATRQPGGEWKP